MVSAASARRACPVAPSDGTGVGAMHRTGVRDDYSIRKSTDENINNPLRGLSIPFRWNICFLLSFLYYLSITSENIFFLVARQHVGPDFNGNRTFGVIPESYAWNPQGGCLFLKSIAVITIATSLWHFMQQIKALVAET